MAWFLKGDASEPLDATLRSFEDLNISNVSLKFGSLAEDTLTWSVEAADATGSGTILPRMGQIVELWWDSARKFHGHVVGIKAGMKQFQITASGPWWWMDRVNLTSSVLPYVGADGVSAGQTPATRPVYVFKADPTTNPTALLNKYIEGLLARAIANGVPMTAGSVATMYPMIQMTLSEQTCASALATLMEGCPDSVAWFDYTGSGLPVFNITRRGVMSPVTYTIATDCVEIGEITPRMDLEVARNELHYVTRNATTGKPAWASQVSGTDPGGKLQIVTVSGPEIVDFLPRDDFESYALQTMSLNTVFAGGFQHMDPSIQSIFDTYGYAKDTFYPAGLPITSFFTGGSPPSQKWHQFPQYSCKTAAGVALLPGSYHLILTASPPSWLTDQGLEVTLSQWFVMVEAPANQGYSPCFGAWRQGSTDVGVDTCSIETPGTINWAVREAKLTGWVLPNALGHTTLTTVYKPWEYTFLTPPTGLAAELVAAQNWVPWEGPITIVSDECSGDNLLPHKFNLANALAACSTMDALAKNISHDLMRGRTTIDLGSPARIDFGTLVSRVRTDPKDNIVYL